MTPRMSIFDRLPSRKTPSRSGVRPEVSCCIFTSTPRPAAVSHVSVHRQMARTVFSPRDTVAGCFGGRGLLVAMPFSLKCASSFFSHRESQSMADLRSSKFQLQCQRSVSTRVRSRSPNRGSFSLLGCLCTRAMNDVQHLTVPFVLQTSRSSGKTWRDVLSEDTEQLEVKTAVELCREPTHALRTGPRPTRHVKLWASRHAHLVLHREWFGAVFRSWRSWRRNWRATSRRWSRRRVSGG